MSRLLLVRHGTTEFNDARKFMGYSDIELNAAGYEQAEKLSERLADEKIDVIYSSDLKRCLEMAEVISSRHKADIIACSELREVSYGKVEGFTYQEIKEHYPEVAESIATFNIGAMQFPGGECFEEFIERTSGFLDRLDMGKTSETVLIVSHSGPLKVLALRLLGIDMGHWRQFRFDNASLSILDTYPQGAILSLLNDTFHLK